MNKTKSVKGIIEVVFDEIIKNLEHFINEPILITLVGQPGAGKSTWINNHLPQDKQNTHVVSTDNILERIAHEQNVSYNDVVESEYKSARTMFNQHVATLIKQKKMIIWDQTNLSYKKRNKIANTVGKDYLKVIIQMTDDSDVITSRRCLRERQTGKFIPPHIVKSMENIYQVPLIAEGADIQYDTIILGES